MRLMHGFKVIVRLAVLLACVFGGLHEATAAGDFNEDGKIDDADLIALRDQIELGENNPIFDLNGDGLVDDNDIELLLPEFESSGDLNLDSVIDSVDANLLLEVVASETHDPFFDMTKDGFVDRNDILEWAHEKFNTYIGDANFDHEFNSSDFVSIF